MALLRLTSHLKHLPSFLSSSPKKISRRGIGLSAVQRVKDVKVVREGKTTTIEGIVTESSRKPYLLKTNDITGACPVCRLGLDIKHTDVLILSQFVRSDGRMLPRRVTGLCETSHNNMYELVVQATRAGLMTKLQPSEGNRNPQKRHKWKACNTYFETAKELKWKEIDLKESYYYERPIKAKKLKLQDIL